MLKKFRYLLNIIILLQVQIAIAQDNQSVKLIVGIVVDQMRFTDLYRYYDYYTVNGFKRLMNQGANFTFAHYNYELTSTGPGHASIYTGTTPFYHGIIANDFFDRKTNQTINCVQDDQQTGIGTKNINGRKSPSNLLASTISDELKLFTNKKSKVFSISIKDRGAILPGGRLADAAFWYDNNSGSFISSSYYLSKLPDWLINFNNKKMVRKYLNNGWYLLYDESIYKINFSDQSPYEKDLFKEGKTSFPHLFNHLTESEKFNLFQFTPFANQLLLDLSKELIKYEKLGQSDYPDFLAISFSTPDLLAHEMGNYSYELMDTYLRLDKQIEELLNFLDASVGENNYLLFLTSDHGAIETPSYLAENKMSVGAIGINRLRDSLTTFSKRIFGTEGIIKNFSNRQIFLNYDYIQQSELDFQKVQKIFAEYLRQNFHEIQSIFTREFLETQIASRTTSNSIINGWNPSRSGDIVFNLLPNYLNNFQDKGTTHGSAYSYDTHVPLIFFGWKIPNLTVNDPVYTVDIAATIANLLNINEPNASIGKPLPLK